MNSSRFKPSSAVPVCLLFATSLFAPSSAAVADASANASMTLEVIQCAQGRTEAPQLSIALASEYPNLRYAPTKSVSAQHLGDGYYYSTYNVPQGNYFLRLQSDRCSGYLQAALLGGHKRALSIALEARPGTGKVSVKLFDSENSLCGTLVVRPSIGWMVAANGATRVLDLQDGAYYIERVLPGKYSLRFELHGSLQSEVSVDLSNISSTQLFERDVDAATFRKNIGWILPHGGTFKECSYCY